MPTRRALPHLRRFIAGILLATPLACLQLASPIEPSRTEHAVAGMVLECPVGSAGCPCTAGGGCDPGLMCISGICSYDDEPLAGSYDYEFSEDLAPPAPEPSRSESRSFARERPAKAGKFRAHRGDAMPEAAAPSTDTGATVSQPVGDSVGPAPATDPAATRRQVIYTATLQLAVYERDAAIELAEELTERWGGWIESRYDYQITLRIPAERLFEAIDLLSELGNVLGKTLRADDVTAEYVDLEARIRVLEQIVAQLELLLKQATSVEQALEIRVELDRIRIELEAARAKMRALSEMIDFSTLTLYVQQRGPDFAVPSSNDPFPWVDELGLEATEYR